MDEISKQKEQINSNNNRLELVAPCTIGNGILPHSVLYDYSADLNALSERSSFFIPASGSGSRMFGFLFEFIETRRENELSSLFFKKLNSFPFSGLLEGDLSDHLEARINIAQRILFGEKLMYSDKPKGLIPFFRINGDPITPFQLQVDHAAKLLGEDPFLHFTVQEKFKMEISTHISEHGNSKNISYSLQDPSTDAYCFSQDGEPLMRDGEYVHRPAGHGALIENLNRISKDYVLIKNIDNVQAPGSDQKALDTWKGMINLLNNFREELSVSIAQQDVERINQLNQKFGFSPDEIDANAIIELKERPIRICGMVRNQGKPGGGPFWVKKGEVISKQIVELSQVTNDPDQKRIVEQSTHFNPVFMVCALTDINGVKLDLNKYVENDLYLKVTKQDNGDIVHYRELPGLWNGSMHYWTTLFIEVPEEVFTPVKTALDLL